MSIFLFSSYIFIVNLQKIYLKYNFSVRSLNNIFIFSFYNLHLFIYFIIFIIAINYATDILFLFYNSPYIKMYNSLWLYNVHDGNLNCMLVLKVKKNGTGILLSPRLKL